MRALWNGLAAGVATVILVENSLQTSSEPLLVAVVAAFVMTLAIAAVARQAIRARREASRRQTDQPDLDWICGTPLVRRAEAASAEPNQQSAVGTPLLLAPVAAPPTPTREPVLIQAGELANSLAATKPRVAPGEKCVVVLRFDPRRQVLMTEEAAHALFARDLPAQGSGALDVQGDGKALGRLAAAFPPSSPVEILAAGDVLEVRCGKTVTRLSREAVARKPMPKNKKHRGKVEQEPEGRHYAPKGDTRGFSAQVPFLEEALAAGRAENERVAARPMRSAAAPVPGQGKP